ncbi:Rho termination factor N-terminal domain-containing protein [Halopseudomonas bauzanensis]|uniref:Rho termination factor, N-terminal domain n=1 Tax=Halopseudomonas bauzanensis TaxID=653930 RepID=A0A1I4JSE0_9GAMM|nr:Rho termination factor N-terminal domain-containing protein [Halopseudomonas bauzanensis]SER54603.1 Rho termination factor, N-terminal domain [Halopseudomonas bauzanensis]SFL69462.1 Rho termination factor, N-terminal domain [Halopseudomonas bauzanensis]
MPQGDKDKYTDKQKRKAEHIEKGYERKGVSDKEAESRAWATVNKQSGGGNRSGGSGQKKSSGSKATDRSDSAKQAAATRKAGSRSASLQDQTKDQLMAKARARDIKGRSSMRKQELVNALRKSN